MVSQATTTTAAGIVSTTIKEPHSYVRVSTFMQKQKGFSLPHQYEVCQVASGNTIKDENQLYDADSGTKFQRKSLQDLLLKVKQGLVSVVYCPKVDRLGRNAKDCLEILEVFEKHSVRLVLIENSIDTGTPMGKLFFTLLAAFAEWEATQIKERTGSGKLEKLEQYFEAARPAAAGARSIPYGLDYILPVKKGLDGEWRLNKEQHHWVLKMYEWTAMGKGADAIALMLNQRNVAAPRGEFWWDVTIRNIIKNTAYIGQLKRKMAGKEFMFSVPRSVPDELFHAANEMIQQNKRNSPRNTKHEYLLSSSKAEPLMKCLVCHTEGNERLMGGGFKPSNTKNGLPERLYYKCSNREQGQRRQHVVSALKIETAVWDYLVDMLKDPSLVLANIKKLSDASSKQYQDLQLELAGLTEKANENKAAQVRLAKLAALGRLSDEVIEAEAIELEQQSIEFEGKIALLRVQLQQAQDSTLPIREIEEACSLLSDGIENLTFQERRWIIRTLAVTIYADKTGWKMEGRLPCLSNPGMQSNFGEHQSSAYFLKSNFVSVTPSNLTFSIKGVFVSRI